jgi:group I intron endonuclease
MIKQAKVYKTPGIYKILNRTTMDFYIGSSMNCYKRMYQHQTLLRNDKHHAPHLQHAWNRYGQGVFEYIVLQYVETDDAIELRKIEQSYLDELLPVYNVSKDAVNPLSTKYTPRKKEHTAKVLPQNKSNWQEIKSKISKTVKALWADDDFREIQLSCMNSPKAKENYSKSMKTRWQSPEYKERMSEKVLSTLSDGAHGSSKFCKDDIIQIRKLASDGLSIKDIANKFESNYKTIRRIVVKETWNFV